MSTGSAGGSRRVGLSGVPATGAVRRAEHRRPAVERLAAAVADPARASRSPTGIAQRARRRTPPGCRPGRMPVGALQHLDHRQVAVDLQHQAVPRPRRSRAGCAANSSQPTPVDAARRPAAGRGARATSVYSTCDRAAAHRRHVSCLQPASIGVAAGRARRRRRPGPASSRARTSGAKSTSSTAAAGTPGVDQRLAAVDDGEHGVDQRGRLRRRRSRRRSALSALCCSTASRSSRPASSTTRSCAGQRADADQLGERGEPVGLGEQADDPRRAGGAQPGSPWPGVPGRRAPRRRGRTTRTRRPPGSAARRRGRGRASTGSGRTARCAR